MILRLLSRNIYQEIGAKNKFGRVQKQLVSVLYSIAAYDIRKTKEGKAIYYMHHYVLHDVAWDTVVGHGYENLPKNSLHNHSVIEEVEKVLERK